MHRRSSRLLLGVSSALTVSLGAWLGVSAAQADPTSVPESRVEIAEADFADAMEWQNSIAPYINQLREAAAGMKGFTGLSFDNDKRTFTVHSTLEPSEAVSKLMAAAPAEVAVGWSKTDFTAVELEQAQADLVESLDDGVGVGTASDFMGLVVTVESSGDSARYADTINGVPIEYAVGDVMLTASRTSGPGPFKGGSRMRYTVPGTSAIGGCSSGFKAYQGSNGVMLTAAHCTMNATTDSSNSGVQFRLTGDNSVIGTSTSTVQEDYDVQAINGQGYSGSIYVGGAGSNSSSDITGTAGSPFAINELLCISGAFSGAACGQVKDTNFTNTNVCARDGSPCHTTVGLIGVESATGNALGGEGDSGSPVFDDDGTAGVKIAGILHAGVFGTGYTKPCNGVITFEGVDRRCTEYMYFSPWFRFKTDFNPNLTLNPS